MKINCLQRVSETAFVCLITEVIIYETFANEQHTHLPHENFNSIPTQITSVTASGTSNASVSPVRLF